MARKILITSGKGGVGKTTLCANMGAILAQQGYRVCLVDMDFGLNNLDVILGIENRINYDIIDAISNKCRIKQALVETDVKNLFAITCLKSYEKTNVGGQSVKLIVETISSTFDFILLDCPAGIGENFHRAVSVCEEAICVTTSQITSIRDSDKVISILRGYNLKEISIVLNKVRGDLIIDKLAPSPLDIESVLKAKLIGCVPDSDQMFLSVGGNLPTNCSAYKSIKRVCKNVVLGESKLYDCTKAYGGIFGKIKRRLKRA